MIPWQVYYWRHTVYHIHLCFLSVFVPLQSLHRSQFFATTPSQQLHCCSTVGTRVRMLTMFNKLMIHFSFAVSLATFWKLINSPSLMSFFQFMGPILGYCLDASFHSGGDGKKWGRSREGLKSIQKTCWTFQRTSWDDHAGSPARFGEDQDQ